MNSKSNKNVVLDFYKNVIGQRSTDLIDRYVSDNYVQHSPAMKDGKAGLREAMEYLTKLPKPEQMKSPIVLALAEGDYVMLLLDMTFMGKHLSVADLFRINDGMVVEHWDAVQEMTSNEAKIPFFDVDENFEIDDEHKTMLGKHFESLSRKVHRMITEGNVVGVQSEGEKSGKRFVFYDFVRIVDSKIVQSWNVEQTIPDEMYHHNGMI